MNKYLRFHLITLIVVQLAAAELLWVNLQEREYVASDPIQPIFSPGELVIVQGWPAVFHMERQGRSHNNNVYGHKYTEFNGGWLVFDVIFWLVLLGGTAAVSEYFIRRRKRAAP